MTDNTNILNEEELENVSGGKGGNNSKTTCKVKGNNAPVYSLTTKAVGKLCAGATLKGVSSAGGGYFNVPISLNANSFMFIETSYKMDFVLVNGSDLDFES